MKNIIAISFIVVVMLAGFVGVTSAQDLDKRVSTVEQRLAEHLKNAGKKRKAPVIVDKTARKGIDELKGIVNGKDGQSGLTKDVADNKAAIEKETTDRTEADKFLAGEINRVDGKADEAKKKSDSVVDATKDNTWWINFLFWSVIVTFIVAVIGWFLPWNGWAIFGTTTGNGGGDDDPPANPPANSSIATRTRSTNQAPLGLGGDDDPPANPLVAQTRQIPNQTQRIPQTTQVGAVPVATQVPVRRLASKPTVTSVSNSIRPNMIPISGGWEMSIVGTGFMQNAKVFFGENEATSVTYVDTNLIVAVAPASTDGKKGVCDVRVVNPDGQDCTSVSAVNYF